MSLEKASISWSAKQLKNMIASGKIDFNHIIQRSYVWERKRKSALIESMIIGYPIPPVFAKRSDDGTGKRGGNIYAIMDGKRRLSTVAQFLNDEFALSDLPPVSYMDEANGGECEADISGMKFSELPEALQDHLNSVIFSVTYFAKAVEDGIDADMMADWLVDFFGSHSEEYDIAAGNGSAKNSNIVTRDKVLSESFEQFFTEE